MQQKQQATPLKRSLEPQAKRRLPELAHDKPVKQRFKPPLLGKLAASLILAAIASIGFSLFLSATPGDDEQTPKQIAQAEQSYARLGTLTLPAVDPSERRKVAKALSSMGLPPTETSDLSTQITSGTLKLVQLSLWDSVHLDGDAVSVNAAGYTNTVQLTHAPQTIYLPLPPGVTTATIRAVADGRGGVTLGIATPSGALPLPPLLVGQELTIQLQ